MTGVLLKKRIFLAGIMLFMLFGTSCGNTESYQNEPEYKYVVSKAKFVKSVCKDPESFAVSGPCKYSVNNQETRFVVIPFKAKNSFGGYVTDTAYFSKDEFRGTYNGYSSPYSTYDVVTKIIIADMISSSNWDRVYTAEQVNRGL